MVLHQTKELMRVGHPVPGVAQGRCARDVALRRQHRAAWRKLQRWCHNPHVAQQVSPKIVARARLQMHLVDGIPGRVKDLQTALRAVFARFLDREGVNPVLGENPQVNLGVQHHRGERPGAIVGIGSAPFVDAMFVPGQRHHVAQTPHPGDQPVGIGDDGCGAVAHKGRDEFNLGDLVLGGEIAGARLRGLGAKRANLIGAKPGHGHPSIGSGGRASLAKSWGARGIHMPRRILDSYTQAF